MHVSVDPTARSGSRAADRRLLWLIDGALAGVVFGVPLLLGGRCALGQLALVCLAAVAAVAAALRRSIGGSGGRHSWASVFLLAAAVGLVGLQVVRLPEPLLAQLAPHTSQLLGPAPGEPAAAGLSPWRQISLAPARTQAALVLLVAYALIFLATVERLQSLPDVERLLGCLAWAALGMAMLGIAQYAAGNGRFLWVIDHPYATASDAAKGSFTNRNHFAHWLALGTGPVVWWIVSSFRRGQGECGQRLPGHSEWLSRPAYRIIAAALLLLAGGLSLSRGGMGVIVVAAAIAVVIAWKAGMLKRKPALSGLAAVLIALLAAGVCDYSRITRRLATLNGNSLEAIDAHGGRRTIWRTVLRALPDYSRCGAGVGTLPLLYPTYLEQRGHSLVYTHAENGYLQIALETGWPGTVLLLAGMGLIAGWCITAIRLSRSGPARLAAGALVATLAVSALHSLVDFVWYVPACMSVAAMAAAGVFRLSQLARCRGKQLSASAPLAAGGWLGLGPRPAAILAFGAAFAAGLWMVATQWATVPAEYHWHRYLALERQAASALAQPAQQAGPEQSQRQDSMVAELRAVIDWQPSHADARLRLAGALVQQFHAVQQTAANNMPLSQLGDVVAAGGFADSEASQAWLERAIGEPQIERLRAALREAREALAAEPLHGEGYLHLAQLCFVGGHCSPRPYLSLALRVRPYDGAVLFHTGRAAWMAGDYTRGLELWRQAFQCGEYYQRLLLEGLAGNLLPDAPADELAFMLSAFQPDLNALGLMSRIYRKRCGHEELVPLHLAHARMASSTASRDADDGQAAEHWYEAMVLYEGCGEKALAIDCGRRLIERAPLHFRGRYRLGELLAEAGHWQDASEQLEWCAQRQPASKPLRNLLMAVRKRQFDSGGILDRSPPSPVEPASAPDLANGTRQLAAPPDTRPVGRPGITAARGIPFMRR